MLLVGVVNESAIAFFPSFCLHGSLTGSKVYFITISQYTGHVQANSIVFSMYVHVYIFIYIFFATDGSVYKQRFWRLFG